MVNELFSPLPVKLSEAATIAASSPASILFSPLSIDFSKSVAPADLAAFFTDPVIALSALNHSFAWSPCDFRNATVLSFMLAFESLLLFSPSLLDSLSSSLPPDVNLIVPLTFPTT